MKSLIDPNINVKIKLSVLWVSVTLCYLYGDYFEFYVPEKVEGLINGDNILNSPIRLFLAALLMVIPALMVVLSLLLKPLLAKWLNIVFGIFFSLIMLLIVFYSITPWLIFYVFLAVVEIVLTSLIVWYALKWPKNSVFE